MMTACGTADDDGTPPTQTVMKRRIVETSVLREIVDALPEVSGRGRTLGG